VFEISNLDRSEESNEHSAKNPNLSLSHNSSRIIMDDLVSESDKCPIYQKLLTKLPIIEFASIQKGSNGKCLICQEEMSKVDMVRMLTCFHHYHVKCIDQWLKTKRECPLCKEDQENAIK
jgi:hypothetical protein